MEGDDHHPPGHLQVRLQAPALVPTGIRPEFVDKLADRGIILPAGLFGARRCGSDEAAPAVPHHARSGSAGRRRVDRRPAHAQVTAGRTSRSCWRSTPRASMRGQAIEQTKAAANRVRRARCRRTSASAWCPSATTSRSADRPTTDRALLSRADHRPRRRRRHRSCTTRVIAAVNSLHAGGRADKVLVVLSDGKDDGSATTLEAAVAAVQGEHVETISLTNRRDRPRERFRPSVRSPRPTTRRRCRRRSPGWRTS